MRFQRAPKHASRFPERPHKTVDAVRFVVEEAKAGIASAKVLCCAGYDPTALLDQRPLAVRVLQRNGPYAGLGSRRQSCRVPLFDLQRDRVQQVGEADLDRPIQGSVGPEVAAPSFVLDRARKSCTSAHRPGGISPVLVRANRSLNASVRRSARTCAYELRSRLRRLGPEVQQHRHGHCSN
jgi:hypothetical protein